MGLSRREIVDAILNTTRQSRAQIGTLVEEFVNLSINEVNDPGWAFPKGNVHHIWNFLRRKTTFDTVSSTADYVLERDIDRIGLLRQTNSPLKLTQVPDEKFFELIPNPTDSGNPRWYRLWEADGVATRLSTADTIDVVSSSAGDAGDSALSVTVSGYDANGIWRTETYALNGTTVVSGTVSFAAREIFVSKQKNTTGTITVTENSGGTTLVVLGPNERSPRFKILSLYPIPSSAITMYIEYYGRIPTLVNDSDSPLFDEKWHYVLRLGGLAKTYQYLNQESNFVSAQGLYSSTVRSMVNADSTNPDLIEYLSPRRNIFPLVNLKRADDVS